MDADERFNETVPDEVVAVRPGPPPGALVLGHETVHVGDPITQGYVPARMRHADRPVGGPDDAEGNPRSPAYRRVRDDSEPGFLSVPCPQCGAAPGHPCTTPAGLPRATAGGRPHERRVAGALDGSLPRGEQNAVDVLRDKTRWSELSGTDESPGAWEYAVNGVGTRGYRGSESSAAWRQYENELAQGTPVSLSRRWVGPVEVLSGSPAAEAPVKTCGVWDGPSDCVYGVCGKPAGHVERWHAEYRDGELWAEWSGGNPGPLPEGAVRVEDRKDTD